MYWSLLFWLLLTLPGFVLVRRFARDQLGSGLLGVVSLSWLATCALLAPVALILYILRAPLAAFSGAIVLAVLLALIEITRRRWWRDAARLLSTAVSLEILILVLDLLLSARVGSFLSGDAQVHLSRIRHILDHGLNNYDPFVIPTSYLFPIYHTNLLHALYAAASQLTGINHLDVWYASLPWGQVLVTSGCYYLAWTVFQDRRTAWLAAMFVIASRGPVNFVIYPNQLSPFWLWPMLIAFVIRLIGASGRIDWFGISAVVSTSLVMGMVHSLYAVFAALAAVPIIAAVLIWRVIRKRQDRLNLVLCGLALFVGTPFALASRLMTPHAASADTQAAFSNAPPPTGDYYHFPNSKLVMRHARSLPDILGGSKPGTIVFLAGLVAAVMSAHRRRAIVLASFSLVAMLILFVPYLCTPLFRVLGEEWVLTRFEVIFSIVFFSLAPPAIGMFIINRLKPPRLAKFIGPLLSVAALISAYFLCPYEPDWTWRKAFELAWKPADQRRADLNVCHALQSFAKQNIPRGKVVLAHPVTGIMLTAIHDVRLVASASGSNGVPDLAQRLRNLLQLLVPQTPWPDRKALLQKYEIEYFLPAPEFPVDWAEGHISDVRQANGFVLLRLKY